MRSFRNTSRTTCVNSAGTIVSLAVLAAVLSVPLSAQNLPDGNGKAQLTATCTVCHGVDIIVAKKLTKQVWKGTVDQMVARGASASSEDLDAIVEYLTTNFGPADAAKPAASIAQGKPAEMPDGAGKEVILRICTTCHLPDHFAKYRKSPEDWSSTVARMAQRAPSMTPEEIKSVTDYLTKNFPRAEETDKVNVNKANAKQLQSLGFTADEATAILAYHKDHGDFRVWGEMLVIYGVDGFKVESLKEKMSF
jgi:competence protein ComEA